MDFTLTLKYIALPLIGYFVTMYLTRLYIRVATALKIVDKPDSRRIHTRETPRGGGIALFLGFCLTSLVAYVIQDTIELKGSLDLIWFTDIVLIGGLLVALGFVDDVFNLKWILKLSGQILLATTMFFLDYRIGHIQGFSLPFWLDYLATVFWYLSFINAFNLIDGLDGLATGLASIASLGLVGTAVFRHAPLDTLLILGLIGSCIGFLRYNFYPARVFLGDAGSMFLGFILAAIALSTSGKSTVLASLGVPLLAIGVPIFDIFLAVWRRSTRGLNQGGISAVVNADLDHLHHRLLRAGLTQKKVAMFLYAINGTLVTVALLSLIYHSRATGILLIAFVMGTYVVVKHLASVELWDSGYAILKGLKRPNTTVIASLLYPAFDFAILAISLLITIALIDPPYANASLKTAWLELIPLWCSLPFIALLLSRTYSRVWSRARISEFGLLVASFLGGVLIAAGISNLLTPEAVREDILLAALYGGFAVAGITTIRAFPRIVDDVMAALENPSAKSKRLLLYGAGTRGISYLRHLRTLEQGEVPRKIVGFIDDDLNLRRRYVHGVRILGTGSEISRVIAAHQIDEVILTSSLAPETLSLLISICSNQSISLKVWQTEEQEVGTSQLYTSETENYSLASRASALSK